MKQIEAQFSVSPRILDHLGIAAYNSLRKCLAELAANSYDADAMKVSITLPDAINEDAFIDIEDNGTGMSEKDVCDNYLFIGRDRRKDGDKTSKGRLVIGSKGIGKLAGFGVASRMEVTTWKDGTQVTFILDRESFDDMQALSASKISITSATTAHNNGTRIRLAQLSKDLQLPDAIALRRHLHKALPERPDFRVFVNDVECTAEDVPGERQEISQLIRAAGTVKGFYIIANSRQASPGLSIRVRGRLITEPSLFGLDTRAHGFFTAEKIVGELNADFLDPEGSSGHIHGLINTSRDGFLEDSPIVKALQQWAQSFLKDIIQGVDAKEQKKRTNELLEKPGIRERFDRMPAHVRSVARKVIEGVVPKLRNVGDEEAEALIEWILRYYESNVLRELMKVILAANINETEKLAGLLQDWGLKQVTSVVEIIKEQIEIIGKLEELVQSNKSKEVELHTLIEKNLWLVREGLELWSSDKPLKAVLDGRINQIYKDKQDLRPDLVCKSRDQGNEAVIIEFKRPKEKIVMDHVTQAMEYEGLIKKHRPSIAFNVYVVGREYDPGVLAMKDKLERASVHLWSFEEILQKSRIRFEEILEILGR